MEEIRRKETNPDPQPGSNLARATDNVASTV